jgi:tetratricopeptide (TPR) repeat protein
LAAQQSPSKTATRITQFLNNCQVPQALAVADSLLKAQPNDVEALMLQGQVQMAAYHCANPPAKRTLNDDPDIYNPTIYFAEPTPPRLDTKTALHVSGWYRKALAADPQRVDIYFLLAEAFAQGGLEDSLAALYGHMAAQLADPELPLILTDYSVQLAYQRNYKGAERLFELLINLFPDSKTMVTNLAVIRYQHRDFLGAQGLLELRSRLDRVEERSYLLLNTLQMYRGDFDGALQTLQTCYPNPSHPVPLFLEGMLMWYNRHGNWRKRMEDYRAVFAATPGYADFVEFYDLLLADSYQTKPDGFRKLVLALPYPHYAPLVYERALAAHPGDMSLWLDFADFQASGYNYYGALHLLGQVDSLTQGNLPPALKIRYHLVSGWCYQNIENFHEADGHWLRLFDVADPMARGAALWFFGQNLARKGQDVAARALYEDFLKQSPADTKYRVYMSRYLGLDHAFESGFDLMDK